jgi:hypothetical protein
MNYLLLLERLLKQEWGEIDYSVILEKSMLSLIKNDNIRLGLKILQD